MGILNVTPDSFSDGGAYLDPKAAVAHGLEMVRAGAAIVDVGGESTRPGATPVTPDEEWDRIGEVVAALVEAGVCVSVDTRHAEVAVRALHARRFHRQRRVGFSRPAMREAVRRCGCGCVVMHMKGEPATMQDNPRLPGRGGRSARLPARCGRRFGGGWHRPLPHLRRSGPWLRQDAQANHRAHAQSPRDRAPGLSGHGGGLAQALRGRGLPCGRASRPRCGLGG